MTVFLIVAAITFFLALTLMVLLVIGRSPLGARLVKLTDSQAVEEQAQTSAIQRLTTAVSTVISPVRRGLGFSENPDLGHRLSLAGYRHPEAVELFYAAKMFALVLGAAIAGFVIKQNVFFWFILLSVAGFLLPDLWLTSAVTKRRERIRLSLPDALDLLCICMEAGLGMDQALIRVGQELKIAHPDISDEFSLINLEQRAGKPRLEAWRNMAERTNLEIVRSFVAMLVQTERFGTPISRSLSNFADALRTKRRQMAEEMAAKTTIKMIFPLVLFIFPSMFIVLLAPAIISIMQNLQKFFH